MSINSEIERIRGNIAASYAVAEEKGATMPAEQNSANLAETLASITSGKPKKLLSSLTNGSTVSVLEDGMLTQFLISHNYEPDLNGSGRTLFVRKDLHSQRVWHNSNYDAYASSDIDAWLNGDYKNMLSPTVKANMGATTFKYTPSNSNKTVTTLAKSVFLPSVTEFGLTFDGANVEGSALPIAGSMRVGYLNGTAYAQWTRSPYLLAAGYVCFISTTGTADAHPATNIYKAVRPCFTLPSDMAIREEPLPDGSWALADEEFLFDTETAKTSPKSAVTYTNGIADLDAATLHEIGKAISSNPKITNETSVVYYDSGDVHRKISVGDTLNNSIDGTTYALRIIGFNHDTLSLSSSAYEQATATGRAGMTIQMVDCLPSKWQMNTSVTNAGSWGACQMRTTRMPYIEERLPEGIRSVIKDVKKLTSAGSQNTTIVATDDKLFLLADIENFGKNTYSAVGEGTQYAYYKAGNSVVKKSGGTATDCWDRSPHTGNNGIFCGYYSNGDATGFTATDSKGVAFAYCI